MGTVKVRHIKGPAGRVVTVALRGGKLGHDRAGAVVWRGVERGCRKVERMRSRVWEIRLSCRWFFVKVVNRRY